MKKWMILIFIVLLGGIVSFFYFLDSSKEESEIIEEEPIIIEEENPVELPKYVEIKGAVKKPGVYVIEENERIFELIEKAGGLKEGATTDNINLSKKLEDEMKIIIYTQKEIEDYQKESISKYEEVKIPCICPNDTNSGCLEEEKGPLKTNINTASKEELMKLSGIGESKAKAIIEYREKKKFETIEELKSVAGIGETLFETIQNDIMV